MQEQADLSDRQIQIHEMIRHAGFLTVEELASRLDVAPQTVRRDVNHLCDLGLARRRHGGVERTVGSGNLAYAARRNMGCEAKQAIATAVAQIIPNGASLSLGIGTTPALVVDALLQHDSLRIYTNNLSAALMATVNPEFEVHIASGRIRNSDQDVTGSAAQTFFGSYKTDFGVYGVGGVDSDGCLLDFSDEEVLIRERIRENCRHSILVLDASKFERSAQVRGGWLYEADTIVCNAAPPPALASALISHQRQLVVAPARS